MSVYELHFAQVSDLIAIERRMVRALGRDPSMLPKHYRYLYRYAINLAKLGWLRIPDGRDIFLADALSPFRAWLREKLLRLVPRHFMPDAAGLHELAPLVTVRTEAIRHAILQSHLNDFGEETLDHEIGNKKLALVLGGGGGSGLAHLGLFSLLHEMNLEPSYILGASMGALVGLIRSVRRRYDPVAAMMALPRPLDLTKIFRPFSGNSRFGFPGALHLDLVPFARSIFKATLGTDIPHFDQLPIPFEVITTGILRGVQLDASLENKMMSEGASGFNPLKMRGKIRLFFDTVKQLVSNPRFLTPIVFGSEPGTENIRVIEAIGFSCAVPGLLHFDLFNEERQLAGLLNEIFERHRVFRLTDGGIVNNVPSSVAWNSIQKGKIGHRNAFIYAVDPFAPVANRNALFIPMQQLTRPAVLADRPYSDFTRTLKDSPSPINLAPTLQQLKSLTQKARTEFLEDVPFIRGMMTSIPPFKQWLYDVHLPLGTYRRVI